MKTLLYDNEKYWITRSDSVTVAVRPEGVARVRIMTVKENGEITVISRLIPWLNQSLKMEEAHVQVTNG